jgi:polysaccharide biosynthesis/export protein
MKLSTTALCLLAFGGLAWCGESTDSATPQAPAQDFSIGIEDVLQVSVWGEPTLNHRVRVRPDGKITFPLVNDMKVEGMTPEQVRGELAKRLASYVRDPNVTVSVEEINSFRVYVLGEVGRQGPINLFRPTRLLQVIAGAGGLTQFSKKEVTILREQDGVEHRIRVDYKKLVAGDATQSNPFMKPGDTVLVD